jgi:hypothetical protein
MTTPASKWIVRINNGLAIKFHPDRIRNLYEAVTDAEATQFDIQTDAWSMANDYGMRVAIFHVEQLTDKRVPNRRQSKLP